LRGRNTYSYRLGRGVSRSELGQSAGVGQEQGHEDEGREAVQVAPATGRLGELRDFVGPLLVTLHWSGFQSNRSRPSRSSQRGLV